MTAEELAAAEAAKNKTPPIDMEKFKEEIKEQNASLLSTVLEKINEKKTEQEEDPKTFSYDAALKEFEDDLADLRVDETQAKALFKIFNKVLSKENPKVKDEIIKEVNSTSKAARDKENAETEMASMYPDILNKQSKLFKQAQVEYGKLSDAVKKSAEGTTVAILKAAAALAITPIDLKTIRSMNAMGPSGGGKPSGENEKVSQNAIDFAASFGVKKEKFEEKLKEIKAKSR